MFSTKFLFTVIYLFGIHRYLTLTSFNKILFHNFLNLAKMINKIYKQLTIALNLTYNQRRIGKYKVIVVYLDCGFEGQHVVIAKVFRKRNLINTIHMNANFKF